MGSAHLARNYAPLPVTIVSGRGAWVRDVDGKAYLDLLCAYSALNFGHCNERLVAAAERQLRSLTLTSRAFSHDQLEPFCAELAALCGKDAVLPMNTGAEAVETAIKAARRWGYEVKGVAPDRARIVVFENNFHGRTTTIVGFSTDPDARRNYGPYAPGFVSVPFGDAGALAEALADDDVVAVLLEPIQGEAGVLVPPDGYLAAARRLCNERNVLFMADEIQTGLGRTGRTFACDHEEVVPDIYILGKALGGGIVPLSAVVADWDVLGVFTPGSHGSTFGGNALACAVGREVVSMLATGEPQQWAAERGEQLHVGLAKLVGNGVAEVRGRGLWAGVVPAPGIGTAYEVCLRLLDRGLLGKDAHGAIRMAPALVVEEADLDWAVEQLSDELHG
jgi:ornithine--oxo-acid transaminase